MSMDAQGPSGPSGSSVPSSGAQGPSGPSSGAPGAAGPSGASNPPGRPGPSGPSGSPIRVLVVEDDPVAADAHQLYVGRVPGFSVEGVAHSRVAAGRLLDRTDIDLILLDLYLPDGHGLQLLRSLRAAGHHADVIAVTSARDLTVVREGVSLGVVQYVLKPFTFATLRDRLTRYAEFRAAAGEASGQEEVDRALGALRAPQPSSLPKGLSAPTLEAVTRTLRASVEGLTAAEAGALAGISRITARRYLEHLVTSGRAERSPQYGHVGRPELQYRWVSTTR